MAKLLRGSEPSATSWPDSICRRFLRWRQGHLDLVLDQGAQFAELPLVGMRLDPKREQDRAALLHLELEVVDLRVREFDARLLAPHLQRNRRPEHLPVPAERPP